MQGEDAGKGGFFQEKPLPSHSPTVPPFSLHCQT